MSWTSGDVRLSAAAKRTTPPGIDSLALRRTFCPPRASFIRGLMLASPSLTQGGSRMPKSGPFGSVRGVCSNAHPYRDSRSARYPALNRKAPYSGKFAQVARHQSEVERKCVRRDQHVERAHRLSRRLERRANRAIDFRSLRVECNYIQGAQHAMKCAAIVFAALAFLDPVAQLRK